MSRLERIETSVLYARLGARKFLEADGKGNKEAFPALHRLEKSESFWLRDRTVQLSNSTGERIHTSIKNQYTVHYN